MLALSCVLVAYLLLGIAFLGWGNAAVRLLRSGDPSGISFLESIWLGWATVLFVLQLLHFLLPVSAYVAIGVFSVGIGLAVRALIYENRIAAVFPLSKGMAATVAVVVLVSAWIALRSLTLPITNYDTGLYHFNAIRWMESYAIVPGLGNLHGRLGFNSALFPFVAALDFYPFFDQGHFIANSFLLVTAIGTVADLAWRAVRQPGTLSTTHPFRLAAPLLALPPLAYIALAENYVSPTPDIASTILLIVLFVVLCDSIGKWRENDRNQDGRAAWIAILAATAVTVKLSNLGFAAGVAGFVAAYWLTTSRGSMWTLFRQFLPAAAVILVWSAANFVLTGAPLYPSTIGLVPVEWGVPHETVTYTANWVFSWARKSHTHWSNVLGSWDWVRPWFLDRVEKDPISFVYPLSLSALFLGGTVGIALTTRTRAVRLLEWTILVPPVVGLIYWFFTAPDMRFAKATFYMLSLSTALLVVLSIRPLFGTRALMAALVAVFLVGNVHFIQFAFYNKWLMRPCAVNGTWLACIPDVYWRPKGTVSVTPRTTESGLVVFSPTRGEQCWDSPLLCTPDFDSALRLRKMGDLSSGFTVAPPP